jgi:hypothetical protein
MSIGCNEVCGQNVIDREAELPIGSPKASAERESADARMGNDARGRREIVRDRCCIQVPQERSAADYRCFFVGVDLDRLHKSQINHQPAFAYRFTREAVAATLDCYEQPSFAGELHRILDI